MTPALELVGVRKRYGAVTALHEISLAVAEGALVFLLGPSGCGKTTALRIISGFIPPDGGRVLIRGESVEGTPPERRGLGMVFQHLALFPHMTVFQNVAFGLRMRRVSADALRQRVKRALDLVQLRGLEGRYPRALSGGQQQRVALARAVVIEPALLLLDEPLSSLDLKLRLEMRAEIRALQRALGITTLFVTHDQDEALTMADEIVVMNQGRIVQIGTPAALYEQPASRFVAHFLGESNLESGAIATTLGPGRWRVDAGGLEVVATGAGAWQPGDAVTVVVRPERVRLDAGEPGAVPGEPNVFPVRIEECIFRGALRRYRVRLPHGGLWSVDEPAGGAPVHAVGTDVRVRWRAEDCLAVPES
ncbi:MAG TPA: ABC transporter ATP-binding protein [Methylomirabilota bacterium]|nr:ABC transporter ATP-binding protein [Methylomirabilota bacterium]